MLAVTRLNGSELYLNPDLILSLEATPDTVVTMTNGEKFVVHETIPDLIERYTAFKKLIWPESVTLH